MKNILFLFIVAFLALAGCFEQPHQAVNGLPGENKTHPVVPPSFAVVSPEEGEVITVPGNGGPVSIILTTNNLVIKLGGEKKFGEGHFVFVLDDGARTAVYGKSYAFDYVPAGEHTLYIELVHNDGTSYVPKIFKSLHFMVASSTKQYQPSEYIVNIDDFSYEPSVLEVDVGDSIVWVNKGSFPRSATCPGIFDSQMIGPGKNATTTMSKAFECDFFSVNYPDLKGHIKVSPVLEVDYEK